MSNYHSISIVIPAFSNKREIIDTIITSGEKIGFTYFFDVYKDSNTKEEIVTYLYQNMRNLLQNPYDFDSPWISIKNKDYYYSMTFYHTDPTLTISVIIAGRLEWSLNDDEVHPRWEKYFLLMLKLCKGFPIIQLKTDSEWQVEAIYDILNRRGDSGGLEAFDKLTLPEAVKQKLHKKYFVDVVSWINKDVNNLYSALNNLNSFNCLYFTNDLEKTLLSPFEVATYFYQGMESCRQHPKPLDAISCLEHVYSVQFTSDILEGILVCGFDNPFIRILVCPDEQFLQNKESPGQHDFTQALHFTITLCGNDYMMLTRTYDADYEAAQPLITSSD